MATSGLSRWTEKVNVSSCQRPPRRPLPTRRYCPQVPAYRQAFPIRALLSLDAYCTEAKRQGSPAQAAISPDDCPHPPRGDAPVFSGDVISGGGYIRDRSGLTEPHVVAGCNRPDSASRKTSNRGDSVTDPGETTRGDRVNADKDFVCLVVHRAQPPLKPVAPRVDQPMLTRSAHRLVRVDRLSSDQLTGPSS